MVTLLGYFKVRHFSRQQALLWLSFSATFVTFGYFLFRHLATLAPTTMMMMTQASWPMHFTPQHVNCLARVLVRQFFSFATSELLKNFFVRWCQIFTNCLLLIPIPIVLLLLAEIDSCSEAVSVSIFHFKMQL